ncbi:MAG: dimethylarginine dimethylaminohydrolase family protein [Beijerinckiaceae bacterium]
MNYYAATAPGPENGAGTAALPNCRQKVLMCAPDHFGVNYVINPWMDGNRGRIDHALAVRQWNNLKNVVGAHADITLIEPQPDLPDMVFTANAGMVLGKLAVASRFRYSARQGEERYFGQWFEQNGFPLAPWPEDIFFEGAGDALLDRGQPIVWCGYGFRSDKTAPAAHENIFKRPVVGLRLIDPRFYHLDTCFCPLEGGYLIYYPAAFDAASRAKIETKVAPEKRVAVGEEDAEQFACNAVDLDGHVFLNGASAELQERLRAAGFTPVIVPLSEFMRAGGAAKCLTLKLKESWGLAN